MTMVDKIERAESEIRRTRAETAKLAAAERKHLLKNTPSSRWRYIALPIAALFAIVVAIAAKVWAWA